MKDSLRQALTDALAAAQDAGRLPRSETPEFVIEVPRQADHGDLASNLAMQLARPLRMNPRAIAETLLDMLGDGGGILEKAEIAGPGFINFFLKPGAWLARLPQIAAQGTEFGRGDWGAGRRVMVEFVSANPTGPLHVGHGRGAALGDALARLLRFSGFETVAEYYINDAGNQMAALGRSVLFRARELRPLNNTKEPFPDKHYQGEYIKDLAEQLLQERGGDFLAEPEEQAAAMASAYASQAILAGIREDLAVFGVEMDNWFSERAMVESGEVDRAFQDLEERGLLYEEEGALWFKAAEFGDEKDRVVRRSNGETTYFASDIAYHRDKFARGFQRLIDVWGADHHGYVPRLKAAMEALGRQAGDLEVVLVQMVNLLRGGKPAAMSTRGGEFVTLREVVDEVGADSARFIFLSRRSDSPLDFDLEAAKAQSMDNPVFYVQYAHTRVCSILRKAQDQGAFPLDFDAVDSSRLTLDEEVGLARLLGEYPEMVRAAAESLEPHRIVYYLQNLAGRFHSYYNAHKVLVEDPDLAAARLLLVRAAGHVLAGGLALLGVSAPERM